MFTRELEICLMAAQREAKNRKHEYLCVEHILYALLHHDGGIRISRFPECFAYRWNIE